jgi:hypothetical protein
MCARQDELLPVWKAFCFPSLSMNSALSLYISVSFLPPSINRRLTFMAYTPPSLYDQRCLVFLDEVYRDTISEDEAKALCLVLLVGTSMGIAIQCCTSSPSSYHTHELIFMS